MASSPASSRSTPIALVAGLIVLGVVFAVIGVVYEIKTAGQLPAFFPGHQAGSTTHHIKHGIAAFVLALLCWGGAWFSTGRRTHQAES